SSTALTSAGVDPSIPTIETSLVEPESASVAPSPRALASAASALPATASGFALPAASNRSTAASDDGDASRAPPSTGPRWLGRSPSSTGGTPEKPSASSAVSERTATPATNPTLEGECVDRLKCDD